jgi:hypothetical protein
MSGDGRLGPALYDTLTSTTLVTAQMVSDEVTGCQAGETQVSVLVAK